MPVQDLDTLIEASPQNLSQFKGLTASYVFLGFGVPTIDGYEALIAANNDSNFGAGPGVTFNDENVYINTMNALYQGPATAKANFDAIVGGGATLQDKLGLVYDAIIPAAQQSDAGRAYFISQSNFYQTRAAELGIAGENGAALVAAAALIKIAVDNDIPGIGDSINDLRAAVNDGSAMIPENGPDFTPIETADGANFDADDGSSTEGSTFTLTTGIDNVKGTGQDDVILGVYNGGTVPDGTTFNTGDTLDGQGGNDTLRVVATVGGTVVPNLSGIETIDGQLFGANLAVNLATSSDVTKLSASNGNGFLIGQNVGALVTLELNNTTGGVQVGYQAAVVAGTEDVQNVAVNSSAGTVFVAGVETMNVTSTGAFAAVEQNQLGITAPNLKTLNIDGDGKLVLGALDATVTTVDASKSTGGVDLTANAASANMKLTGGSGDDTFRMGLTLTKTDTVDGGEGIDTVGVTETDISLAANATLMGINALTNVERVAFAGATATLNGSTFTNAAVTNLLFQTVGADIINNAGSARTYEFGSFNGGAATFNMKGGSTTVNIDLLGFEGLKAVAQDGANADVAGLTVNLAGVELPATVATINLTSSGDLATFNIGNTATYNETGVITAKAGSTITIDGNAALGIDGLANRATVDASALTGKFVIEGSEATLAAVVDAALSGADIITLAAGTSRVEFNSGLDSGVDNNTTGAAAGSVFVDTVIGLTGGTGGDVLDWTPGADVKVYTALTAPTQASIDALAGPAATLEAALNIAATANAVAGWTAFSFQGTTYAIYEDAADAVAFDYATDVAVQLTGVSVAELTAANFA